MTAARAITLSVLHVLSVLSLTACGLLSDGESQSEEPDVARGALEAVADGVTVRLVDVEYASTSTRLHLEIERPEDVFARVGYYYRPPFDPEVHLEGFAPVDRLDITTIGRAEGDVDRIEYGLGEVLDPGQQLVFEISRLCPAEPTAQGQCREGPWRFKWTPGAEAVDPADVTISVGETHSDGVIMVHIELVRISGNEVVVATWSESALEDWAYWPILRLRLPDGSEVPGEGGGGSSEEAPRTLKEWRFPPLPDGVEDFAIEVESYLVPEGHRASFRFSLAGRMNGVDPDANAFTEVEIGEEIEIDGERLRLSYVQVGHGYLNFVIDNVTDGERTIHFGGMGGPAILEDANGHELMPEGGGGNLLGQTSFRFRDVNLDALQRLELSTTTISRLMPGPEPFIIHLP